MTDDDDEKNAEEYVRKTFLASPSELLKATPDEAVMMPGSFGQMPEITGENISTEAVLAGFEAVGGGARFFFRDVDLRYRKS